MASKLPKAYYSEAEAARFLGVTAEQFRVLLRKHIGAREEELINSPVTTYHAADIWVLKMAVSGSIAVPERVEAPAAPPQAAAATASAEVPPIAAPPAVIETPGV